MAETAVRIRGLREGYAGVDADGGIDLDIARGEVSVLGQDPGARRPGGGSGER